MHTAMDRSKTRIVGSNSPRAMDVCSYVSVLCRPVYVEALQRADPPNRETYQTSKLIYNFSSTHISEYEQARRHFTSKVKKYLYHVN
jgi:hypothetical protein